MLYQSEDYPENVVLLEMTEPEPAPAVSWGFHPHVLLAHWELYSRAQQWRPALATSQALIEAWPDEPIGWIYQSFALHQLGYIHEAYRKLLPGARKFPNDWRIAYNLACYACQLGDKAGAWNWLDTAIETGDADIIKSSVLDDPNFKPLWAKLGQPTA